VKAATLSQSRPMAMEVIHKVSPSFCGQCAALCGG
jgi:hypothetical protein